MSTLSPLQQILTDPTTDWVMGYKKDYEDKESDTVPKEYGGTSITHIQAHIREREIRGFSRFDWWNFNSYILWMVAKVSQEVIQGNVQASDDVRKEAQVTLDHLIKSVEHNRMSDAAMDLLYPNDASLTVDEVFTAALAGLSSTPEIWEVVHEQELKEHEQQQQAVSVFFTKVFPHLPSSEDKYYSVPLGAVGNRAQDGYTVEDLTVFRSYLSSIITSGLQQFAGPAAAGFYGNSLAEWREKLHKMIHSFQLLVVDEDFNAIENPDQEKSWQVETAKEYYEGINLFIQDFQALWD